MFSNFKRVLFSTSLKYAMGYNYGNKKNNEKGAGIYIFIYLQLFILLYKICY